MNAEKIKAIQEENKQLKQEKERLCHRVEVLEELANSQAIQISQLSEELVEAKEEIEYYKIEFASALKQEEIRTGSSLQSPIGLLSNFKEGSSFIKQKDVNRKLEDSSARCSELYQSILAEENNISSLMEDFNNISYSNDFPIEQIPVIRSYLIKEKKSQQERFLNLQTHLKDRLKQITLRLEDKSPPTSTQDGNRMIQQQSENLKKIQEIFKHQDTQLTSEIQKNEKLIQQLTNELKTISPLVNARTGNANQNSDMIQTFEETRKVVATILNSSLNGLYNQLATVDDIGNVSASLDSNRSSLDSEASSYLFSRRSERSKSKTRLDDWEENSFLLKKSSLVEEELKKSVMEQLFSLLRQLNVINIESIQTPSEGFLKLSQKIDQLLEERKGFSPNTVITSKEVESLKGQIQKLSAIVTKQRDQISELQNKNPSSSSPYRSLYDEEASLKENITRNQHELQLLTLDFEKLKHDKSSIQSELAVLEDKLTKKRKEVADYEKQSQESVKQFLSLQKEIDEKKKLLEELNKELNSKPEKTNRSSINLEDEKNTELQTQKKVLAQLKQEEYKLIQEKCRLEAELIALEKTIQKYKEEEVRLEKKKQQMITYIEELRSSAQQLSQTNAHLLQVNKGLEKIRNEIQQERNGLVVFIQEKQQMILHLSREINRLKNTLTSSGVSGGSKRNLLQDYTSPSNSSALSNILSQLQNEEVMLDESLAHLKSVENRMSYFDQDRRDTETSSKDLSKYVNMNSNSSSTQIQIEKKKFERLLELIKSKDELFQNVYIEVSNVIIQLAMVSVSPEEAALSSDSPTIHDFQISYDFKYIFENHQCVVSQIKTILKQLWDQQIKTSKKIKVRDQRIRYLTEEMLKYKISVHSLKNQVTLKKEQIEGTQSYFEDDDNKESNS